MGDDPFHVESEGSLDQDMLANPALYILVQQEREHEDPRRGPIQCPFRARIGDELVSLQDKAKAPGGVVLLPDEG